MITLTIPEATPSLNRLYGHHWTYRHQKRKHWQWLVRAARLKAKIFLDAPIPKARVTITRHGRGVCDPDNLIGGQKMLIDSLVQEGILLNDTPDHIDLIVRQIKTKTPHTVVTIEAL